VSGKDRKKELARQRFERQQARREAQARRSQRIKIIGSVVAVVVVAGGTAGRFSMAVAGWLGTKNGSSPITVPIGKIP